MAVGPGKRIEVSDLDTLANDANTRPIAGRPYRFLGRVFRIRSEAGRSNPVQADRRDEFFALIAAAITVRGLNTGDIVIDDGQTVAAGAIAGVTAWRFTGRDHVYKDVSKWTQEPSIWVLANTQADLFGGNSAVGQFGIVKGEPAVNAETTFVQRPPGSRIWEIYRDENVAAPTWYGGWLSELRRLMVNLRSKFDVAPGGSNRTTSKRALVAATWHSGQVEGLGYRHWSIDPPTGAVMASSAGQRKKEEKVLYPEGVAGGPRNPWKRTVEPLINTLQRNGDRLTGCKVQMATGGHISGRFDGFAVPGFEAGFSFRTIDTGGPVNVNQLVIGLAGTLAPYATLVVDRVLPLFTVGGQMVRGWDVHVAIDGDVPGGTREWYINTSGIPLLPPNVQWYPSIPNEFQFYRGESVAFLKIESELTVNTVTARALDRSGGKWFVAGPFEETLSMDLDGYVHPLGATNGEVTGNVSWAPAAGATGIGNIQQVRAKWNPFEVYDQPAKISHHEYLDSQIGESGVFVFGQSLTDGHQSWQPKAAPAIENFATVEIGVNGRGPSEPAFLATNTVLKTYPCVKNEEAPPYEAFKGIGGRTIGVEFAQWHLGNGNIIEITVCRRGELNAAGIRVLPTLPRPVGAPGLQPLVVKIGFYNSAMEFVELLPIAINADAVSATWRAVTDGDRFIFTKDPYPLVYQCDQPVLVSALWCSGVPPMRAPLMSEWYDQVRALVRAPAA